MVRLRICTFGGLRILDSAGGPVTLPARKAALLLVYLAMQPGRPQPRARLAALLWGSDGETAARGSLRQALLVLRRALTLSDAELVSGPGETITLAPDVADVDTLQLEAALAAQDLALQPHRLSALLDGIDGEFLEGLDTREPGIDEWLALRRAQLRTRLASAHADLLQAYRDRSEPNAAIGSALRLLALDPLREDVHRALMELHAGQRHWGAALHQFQLCRDILARELGVRPQPATTQLRDEIERQRALVVSDAPAQLDDHVASHVTILPGRGYRFNAILGEEPRQPGPTGQPVQPRMDGTPGLEPLTPPGVPPLMFGRDDDLTALEHQLREHRYVTVVGAGGIGKTTLALAAAHARKAVHRDGTAWVDLSSVSEPAMVIPAVAQALQLPAIRGERSLVALVASLKPLQLLLVLDNAEHLVEEVARLVHATSTGAPGVRLLVTSQVPLRVADERVLRLGPLGVPESGALAGDAMSYGAVALFVDQARAVDPRFSLTDENVATVIDLCLHLDGLALAIKLAAARLAFFGLHGLEQHLGERLRLLAGGSRSAPTRQQTLRAALDWSYGLLAEHEKAALRALGVFAGGFNLELAGAVIGSAGEDQWTVIEHVSSLVERSLVSVDGGDPPRYRLLESVREYALARLDETMETRESRHRHARAMLSFCDQVIATEPDYDIVERCGRDVDNLRTAIAWSASHDPHLAIDLVGAGSPIFFVLNLSREARRHHEAMEPALASHPRRTRVARFWLSWASHYGSPNVAMSTCASKAAALYRELADPLNLHAALCFVGYTAFVRIEAAEKAVAEAVTLERSDWPASALARRVYAQGWVHWVKGRFAHLRVAAEQAVTLGRSAGMHNFAALCSGAVVRAQIALGELDDALATSRDLLAQETARRGGLLAYAWGTRALCLTRHDDLAEARAAWGEFFGQCRREDWERVREFTEGYLLFVVAERRYATAARLRGYWLETFAQRGLSTEVVERAMQRVESLHLQALYVALDEGTIDRLTAEGRRLDAEAVWSLTLATVDQPT